jgi:hypothetical protein
MSKIKPSKKPAKGKSPPAFAGSLLDLLFDPEAGYDILHRYIGPLQKKLALKSKRLIVFLLRSMTNIGVGRNLISFQNFSFVMY